MALTDENKTDGQQQDDDQQQQQQQPQYVPLDDFKKTQQLLESMSDRFNQLQDNFNAVVASRLNDDPSRSSSPAPSPAPDFDPNELELALQEGKGADKVLKAIDARIAKQNAQILEKLNQLESTGVSSIADLSRVVAASEMKHYARYKKEIDTYVGRLPANLRMNKDVYVAAHNVIVGAHLEELLKEEREKVLREVADPNFVNTQTGINGRKKEDAPKIPSVEQLLGKEAADALSSVGRTADQHAKRLGYKDWAAYAEHIQKSEQETQ